MPVPSRVLLVVAALGVTFASRLAAEPLPGTAALELEGDLADRMVAGIDRFLLAEIDASLAHAAPALAARSHVGREIQRLAGAQSGPAGQDHRRSRRPRKSHGAGVHLRDRPAAAGRQQRALRSLGDSLADGPRRPRRRTPAAAGGTQKHRRRRGYSRCRHHARTNRRAGRRARARGAVRPPPGRERLPRGRAAAHRSRGYAVGDRPAQDEPAAPRVSLPPGVRDGPAHHRLRGAKSVGRGRFPCQPPRPRGQRQPPGDRSGRLRRRRTGGPLRGRRSTRGSTPRW